VGQVEQGERGPQIFVGQVGQGQGVCPLEPFHLSQMGLQGRESFSLEEVDLSFNSETKEHPQISKPSFRKRDRENVFLPMF